MIGLGRRLAAQALSQILFFGVCAPPTESIPQQESQRPAPGIRGRAPFYERMLDGEREMMFLPKKDNYVMQSSEFEQMKKALAPATAQAEKEQKDKPSLLMPEKGCAEPQKADYKPGESIDKICARKAW